MSQQEQLLAMEQVAATQRLGNDKYLFELQDIGRRQRLDTELGMREAITKSVFANQLDLLKEDNAFNKLISLDDAEFKKAMTAYNNQTKLLDAGLRSEAYIQMSKEDAALAKLISDIDIETALSIANADAKASNIRAGVGAAANIGSQTYQAYKTTSAAPPVTAPTFSSTGIGLGVSPTPSITSGMSPTLTPYPSR
jgi:hypothetical protein